MPSMLRAAIAFSLLVPVSARAQQLSAHTTVPITITVRPSIAIQSVRPALARVDSPTRLTSASVVGIESNLPYRVAVRLAPTHGMGGRDDGVRVLVQRADGGFEPLQHGASVTTVVSRTHGQRAHEVVCRVEASAPEMLDAGRCTLIFELSAEHHDSLLRTTVTLPAT